MYLLIYPECKHPQLTASGWGCCIPYFVGKLYKHTCNSMPLFLWSLSNSSMTSRHSAVSVKLRKPEDGDSRVSWRNRTISGLSGTERPEETDCVLTISRQQLTLLPLESDTKFGPYPFPQFKNFRLIILRALIQLTSLDWKEKPLKPSGGGGRGAWSVDTIHLRVFDSFVLLSLDCIKMLHENFKISKEKLQIFQMVVDVSVHVCYKNYVIWITYKASVRVIGYLNFGVVWFCHLCRFILDPEDKHIVQ